MLKIGGVALQISQTALRHPRAQCRPPLAEAGQLLGELPGDGAKLRLVVGDPLGPAEGGEETGAHPRDEVAAP